MNPFIDQDVHGTIGTDTHLLLTSNNRKKRKKNTKKALLKMEMAE